MPVAVLDVGKTNVKLALFDGEATLWQRTTGNQPRPGPPYPHADVEAIWRFFLTALAEAAGRHRIDGIVVTTHGATLALVDEEGLVLPVMDYEYGGVDAIEADYARVRPPFRETFSPPISAGLNFGRQIFYQERRHPDAFARARHILMYPQYFAWRLTGVAAGEVTSLGCHGDLWRPVEGGPSSLVARCGWAHLLPKVRPAFDRLGPVRPEIARAAGLPDDVPVMVGAHDSNASILPHLLTLEPPFTVVSTGTWIVIMAVGGSVDRLDPARDMQAYVDVLARPLPAAKFMGGREFAALAGGSPPEAGEADLRAVLASGAMALPAFVANGGPVPGRPGRVEGRLPDGPAAAAALASLYAALMTDLCLDNLGAGVGALLVEGSFARNALFCGALAALRPGQPVCPGADGGGTAYGASLLAAWPSRPGRSPAAAAGSILEGEVLAHRARWRAALAS